VSKGRSLVIARNAIPGSFGFPVRWFGRFAVVDLSADRNFLTTPALAGELCAALDEGDAAGLIVDLSNGGVCDSSRLDALMRAARRARARGSWLRLVIPDAGVRKMVRLVALDEVMPIHPSILDAVAAAGRETTITRPVTRRRSGPQRHPVPVWRPGKTAAWGG
jgi:anti-sigma B factor antagonist